MYAPTAGPPSCPPNLSPLASRLFAAPYFTTAVIENASPLCPGKACSTVIVEVMGWKEAGYQT
jgi:hypothetical protein